MTFRKPFVLAASVWLALVVVFFWPVIFQGKVLAPLDILDSLLRPWATTGKIEVHNSFTYDAISQYLPYDWSVYQSLRQDGYIGWNPYTHSGTSIVENTMICPGDWRHHLYRFLPFWTAWDTGIILQFALAGLGMLMLLREQKIPAAYALIGVIAFGFYSQFIIWIEHRWVLGAMCWAPWIIWSLLRAKKSGRLVDLPSIAFIALAFRGGHLQACVFIVLFVMLLAAADWWESDQRWNLRRAWKPVLPYAIAGIFGAVFALDVVVETVPALLHGSKDLPARPWVDTLAALPTLVTSVFPTSLGTPQGLDLMKVFKLDLFSIKFMGGVAFLLSALACWRSQAPLAAKVLLGCGLLLPFTPADQWLYSRCTSVFALGAAWLAAWYLTTIANEPPSKVWKRALIILSVVVGVWLIGSAAIAVKEPWLQSKLHEIVLAKLPENKGSRIDWMISRSDILLKNSMVWAPRNLTMLVLLVLGLTACSRIHNQSRNAPRFAVLVALCTFGELLLFANTWMTFSDKPRGDGLYAEPAWATRLKQAVGNGSVLFHDTSDIDYLHLNTPSAYAIRFADGYETVTPRRIDPYAGSSHDPGRCADSGFSHLLVPPGKDPGGMVGWEKIIDSKELVLYKNLAFQSSCTAVMADGSKRPIFPKLSTPNRRDIVLPASAKSVTLMESFNPGWKYSIDGQAWNPVHETELHGMRIDLANPTAATATPLRLQYRPADQSYYRPIMILTAIGLLGFALLRSYFGRTFEKGGKIGGKDGFSAI